MLSDYLEQIRPIHTTPITTSKLISEGMVNDVVIINDSHIYRFPKHDWAFDDMRHEARILTLLKQHVAMPLPDWTIYDDAFVGYPMIQGEPLQEFHLTQMSRIELEQLAAQIGRFLRNMHIISADEIAAHNIRPSVTNRTYDNWLNLYERVQADLFPHLHRHQQTWVHHHFKQLIDNPSLIAYEPCLMNGDLSSYHLLFDSQTQLLNGMIDFGTAGIGDPAVDFVCLLDQYGAAFVQLIGLTYGNLAPLLDRARWWAGTMELQWALGGLRDANDLSWFTVHIGRSRGYRPLIKSNFL